MKTCRLNVAVLGKSSLQENIKIKSKSNFYFRCVYFNGLIFIIGGFNGMSRVRSVDIYNPQTKEWSTGPDMLCRRGTLGVGLLNGKIYAVGGFDGVTGLTSVECWSMKSNENWSMVAPLITRRSSVGIAVLNNYLYASKLNYINTIIKLFINKFL